MFKQTQKQQEQDFKYSVLDGMFWVIMNSLALVFLSPYIIELGASPLQIGILESLPTFIASFLPFISFAILKSFNSKKDFVVFFVTIQALLWFPLAVLKFLVTDNNIAINLIIFIYVLIISAGTITTPVYRDWISKVFIFKKMGSYLARKAALVDLFSIVPLIATSLFLDLFNKTQSLLLGFSLVFIIGGVCRLFSASYINRMSVTETKEDLIKESNFNNKKSIFKIFNEEVLKDKQFTYFLIVVIILFFGIYIADPFFKYYFLKIININYSQYIILQIAYILGSVLSSFYWGKIADNYGATKILKTILFFMPFYPLLVLLAKSNLILLAFVNFFGGLVWAGLLLGIYDYFYQNVKKDIINHFSLYIISASLAMFIGSLVGAEIFKQASNRYNSELIAITIIFVLSAVVRYFCLLYIHKIKDIKRKEINLTWSIILLKPITYGLERFYSFIIHEEKEIIQKISLGEKKIISKISLRKNHKA
ncbi:MAG: MFS transporter [archaeon]